MPRKCKQPSGFNGPTRATLPRRHTKLGHVNVQDILADQERPGGNTVESVKPKRVDYVAKAQTSLAVGLGSKRMPSHISNASALSSRGWNTDDMRDQREKETRAQVEELYSIDHATVPGRATPEEACRRQLARRICEWALEDLLALQKQREKDQPQESLEAVIAANDQGRNICMEAEGDSAQLDQRAKLLQTSATEFLCDVVDEFNQLSPWLQSTDPNIKLESLERRMYPHIQALHQFIAHYVHRGLTAAYGTEVPIETARLILPSSHTDKKAQDSDDQTRNDLTLVCRTVKRGVADSRSSLRFSDAFAIYEAKAKSDSKQGQPVNQGPAAAAGEARVDEKLDSDPAQKTGPGGPHVAGSVMSAGQKPGQQLGENTTKAATQLFMYTRQRFATQPDLRFAWGVTQCGADVRASISINNRCVASDIMNLRERAGLAAYIQLVVNWSLCEWHRLGFDPDIRYLPGAECWKVRVPALPDSFEPTWYCFDFNSMLVAADRLFGRHTRCFRAWEYDALDPHRHKDDAEKTVVIKDAWRYVKHGDDSAELGEIECMKRINKISGHGGLLPEYCGGGIVRITKTDVFGGVREVNDTTDAVLDDGPRLVNMDTGYYNEHVRIAMRKVLYRLREVRSVYELIVVVGDAVEAHRIAFQERNILHGDISDQNIMFWRDGEGMVHGVLIDFDNAVDWVAAVECQRPICTGTLPFMSVNNLKEARVPRTVVDDLESFLYLLIWLGTWGATAEHRQKTRGENRMVYRWLDGEASIDNKRLLMDSESIFNELLSEFYHRHTSISSTTSEGEHRDLEDAYNILEALVENLRNCLYRHGREDNFNQAARCSDMPRQKPVFGQKDRIRPSVDPFLKRTEEKVWRELHGEVIKLFRVYTEGARDIIREANGLASAE